MPLALFTLLVLRWALGQVIAFDLSNHVCGLSKLWPLRCGSRLCRYRPCHWADERRSAGKVGVCRTRGTLPKVVVPVHFSGSSCDMAEIGRLAENYGFAVLEDASHAIGGCYRGEPVGNCRYSDITVFSFHPVKIITTVRRGGHNQ